MKKNGKRQQLKRMTVREKLELMKQLEQRNEERRKEFAKKKNKQ